MLLPLTSPDIELLAHFFQSAFKHFNQYKSSYEETYRKSIDTVITCYTTLRIETGVPCFQKEDLTKLRQDDYFKRYPETFSALALVLAEMISFLVEKVRFYDGTLFRLYFINAAKQLLNYQIIDYEGDITEIQRLHCSILSC